MCVGGGAFLIKYGIQGEGEFFILFCIYSVSHHPYQLGVIGYHIPLESLPCPDIRKYDILFYGVAEAM